MKSQDMRIALMLVATVLLFADLRLQGQVQQNSAAASLVINGQAPGVTLAAGDLFSIDITGAPNSPVLFWSGSPLAPAIGTPAGHLNVWPPYAFLLDGTVNATHVTDPLGLIQIFGQVPWLTAPGSMVDVQAAVQDLASPINFTLSSPANVTFGPPVVTPQHLYFDPTAGALGVPDVLPPAGTLPGDLPTLGIFGFPGPTAVFHQGLPVHGVFESPFVCHSCHGDVTEIWSAYQGTMMANAMRDPLFNGLFAISVAGLEHMQSLGVTNLGGELAADLCIRCHSPNAWQGGRSGFSGDGTPGKAFRPGVFDESLSLDMEGVLCDACHRTTGFAPNASPPARVLPGMPDSGQLIIAPTRTKRGPYFGTVQTTYANGSTLYGSHVPPATETMMPAIPHNLPLTEGTAVSPYHETEHGANLGESTFCGTCHNVTNPLNGNAVERTFAEWAGSDYGDPNSPDYQTCQDCHLPEVPMTQACTLVGSDPTYGAFDKVRQFFRKHEFVGGNAWIPQILKQMYPQVDLNWTNGNNFSLLSYLGPASRDSMYDAVSATASNMLLSAATVDLSAVETTPGIIDASVRVTNLTGHKLPTGYPEGRRMWLHVRAEDAAGQAFFESGLLDANSELIIDPWLKVYEAKPGLNYPSLGLSGPSFHFVLNNVIYKDNRIPPKGNTAVRGLGGTDSYDPIAAPWPGGGLYADNQHWDDTPYAILVPPGAPRPIKVTATVRYQTSSYAFVTFLANGGDAIVQTTPHPDAVTLKNLWDTGYPAPALPVGTVGASSTPDPTSSTPNSTAMVVLP
jgi:hypothetical protein